MSESWDQQNERLRFEIQHEQATGQNPLSQAHSLGGGGGGGGSNKNGCGCVVIIAAAIISLLSVGAVAASKTFGAPDAAVANPEAVQHAKPELAK